MQSKYDVCIPQQSKAFSDYLGEGHAVPRRVLTPGQGCSEIPRSHLLQLSNLLNHQVNGCQVPLLNATNLTRQFLLKALTLEFKQWLPIT